LWEKVAWTKSAPDDFTNESVRLERAGDGRVERF
jgi:hypothetical protein